MGLLLFNLLLFGSLLIGPVFLDGSTLLAQTRPQLPNTPAGDRAVQLFEALEGGEEGHREFLQNALARELLEAEAPDLQLQRLSVLAGRLDEVDGSGARSRGPHELVIGFHTTEGERFRIELTVEEEPPHPIVDLVLERGGEEGIPVYFDTWEGLDRQLRRLADPGGEDRFSGVVLVARENEILFHRAYGEADRDAGLPVRTDTRFNIGSLNKAFTAVAVLRLAREGRVELDAPLDWYLDGLPPEIGGVVTLRQLLQHRSGMGDYLQHPEYRADPASFRTTDDFLEVALDAPLEFQPGSRQRYSNSGYVVLGAVIEDVTGRPYGEVVREWIFQPTGMSRTGLGGRVEEPGTAVPYTLRDGEGEEASLARSDGSLPGRGSPAGGGFSTAEDLFRFARAVAENRLLPPRWTGLLLGGFDPGGASRGRGAVGWAGGAPGLNAGLEFEPGGRVVVVLANRDPPIAVRLVMAIGSQMPGG